MGSLASINIRFKADLKEFSSQMQNATRDIDKIGASMSKVGTGLSLGLTAPILGLGAIAVKTAANFETLKTSLLSTFQGNQSAADAAFKQIQGFAAETPYEMEQVLDAFIKLKNLGLDPSEEALSSYGNTASAMGKSLNQMIEAVADASTGEFERLKEFGIKSKSEGDKVSFTFQGVTTKVGKNAAEIQKYLLGIGNVNFAGAMERQSQTFNGRLSTLKDNFSSLADSFGTIILEFISPLIDSLANLSERFKTLEPGTKKIIVVVAGLAAAIGPLLLAIGGILTIIPTMVAGFAAVKGAILSVTSVIAANPFGAMAIALGAIISTVVIASSRFSDLTNATKEYEAVNVKATQSIAKEKTELEKNLAVAKDEKASKESRKKAIENLNKLSPEYLGNITLENVYTKETTASVNKYNEALLTKAKILAAQEKLVEVQKKLLDLQLGQTEAAKPSLVQNLSNSFLSFGNSMNYASLTAKTMAENLGTEYTELDKLKNLLVKFLGENNALVTSNNEVATSIDAVVSAAEKLPKSGTIAFYEAEISKLQKLQKEAVLTQREYIVLQQRIDAFQSKIDDISAPIVSVQDQIKLPEVNNEDFKESLLKNSEYYKAMVDGIAIEGERLKATQDATNAAMQAKAEELNEAYGIIGDSFMNLFSSYTNGFIESLGIANEGMKSFVQGLVATITKLITMSLAASQASVIQGAAQSGTATGPAAVFTTPAFIATAIAGILSAFASIPKFETGGIVGGASYYGDKILARVNSGELILNSQQQRKLFGMMDSSSSGVAVELGLGTRISGSDIELVVERAIRKNNRKR